MYYSFHKFTIHFTITRSSLHNYGFRFTINTKSRTSWFLDWRLVADWLQTGFDGPAAFNLQRLWFNPPPPPPPPGKSFSLVTTFFSLFWSSLECEQLKGLSNDWQEFTNALIHKYLNREVKYMYYSTITRVANRKFRYAWSETKLETRSEKINLPLKGQSNPPTRFLTSSFFFIWTSLGNWPMG